MNDEWRKVDAIAAFLEETLGDPPQIHIVLGSGLDNVASGLEDERSVEFKDMPEWRRSTVAGHAGVLRRGRLSGKEVLIQSGRIHLYEGYSPAAVVRPVRAMVTWGAKLVILTNAAGVIDSSARPGELMMIEDHINLTGRNPLRGPNDDARGPRFPDMTDIYDPAITALARHVAGELGITLRTGIYAGLLGPSYETPAEVRMLAALGAHAVGMSTVLEAIAARHLGAKLVGISCITNQAATRRGAKLTHAEVQEIGARAADGLARLIGALVGAMKDPR